MRHVFPLASLMLSLGFGAVAAQPRASQHGTLSQEVNTTTISLGYDRPVARGRALFGDLVEWDVVWTPGANRATWIEFSRPVTVEGQAVAPGRYGIWTIPREAAPWDVVLVSDWDTHHSYFPFEAEVARLRVRPKEGWSMETLAFYFPVVGPYDATMHLHWGTTVLPLRVEVERE